MAMLQQHLMCEQMRANKTRPHNDPDFGSVPGVQSSFYTNSTFITTWPYHPKMRQYILITFVVCWKQRIQRAAGMWTRCAGHWILAHVPLWGRTWWAGARCMRFIVGPTCWWFEAGSELSNWYSLQRSNHGVGPLVPSPPSRLLLLLVPRIWWFTQIRPKELLRPPPGGLRSPILHWCLSTWGFRRRSLRPASLLRQLHLSASNSVNTWNLLHPRTRSLKKKKKKTKPSPQLGLKESTQ